MRGSIAYTAQDPWIQNASLRDNVLMGAALEPGRYAAVLSACALDPDIAMLPAGDLTEIGEKVRGLSATAVRVAAFGFGTTMFANHLKLVCEDGIRGFLAKCLIAHLPC